MPSKIAGMADQTQLPLDQVTDPNVLKVAIYDQIKIRDQTQQNINMLEARLAQLDPGPVVLEPPTEPTEPPPVHNGRVTTPRATKTTPRPRKASR